MRILKWVLLTTAFCAPALAQSNSVYNATTYAYTTQITVGNTATGSSSIQANPTAFAQGMPFLPYNLNAPIAINRNATTAETLTPSAIANCFPNSLTCTLSATLSFKHIAGESIQSGTFGLQEALNIAVAAGSGTVLIDASWQGPSGASLITAAKGSSSVMIQDNRNPSGATFYQWNGSAYVAQGGGGGSTPPASPVGSIQTNANGTNFGALNLNGILKQTGTTPGTATGTSNSLTGDYALPFTVSCTGTGLSCSFTAQALVVNLSGAAGSGTVGNGLAHQFASYPSAGTAVQGTPSNALAGYFVIDPSMSLANINSLLSTAPAGSTVIVLNGTPQFAWSNPNHLKMIDVRNAAAYGQLAQFGVACDANQWTLTFTAGSNTVFVGSDFGNEAAGRTLSISGRTGRGFSDTQWAWAPTVLSVSGSNATLSGNAPFSGSFKATLGTLNTTNLQSALDQSGFAFPLLLPSGCQILTGPVNINHATSIIGQQMSNSLFTSLPGQDVLVQPPGGHGAAGNGMRWENFGFIMDASIDWSLGYNQYAPDGSGPTAVPPVYRPAGNRGHEANNVLADDWVTNGSNGVASTTQNTAVVCVPTALGRSFTNGNIIVFPYFTPGVFSTTIVNQTGAGCTSATGLTLASALPNTSAYTVAQAYYVTGSAIQTIETLIPTTMTYPFTLTISLPNGPSPFGIYDFAPVGHVFIGSSQFDYLGINYNNTPGSATMVLRKGPATTPGYSIGSQPIIPANPCPAKFNTPPPVFPNLNGGSDSTPSGAVDIPGHCVGASAIAFPQPDGLSADTGMINSFLTNLIFNTLDVQSQNNVASIYMAGNTGPYGVTFSGEKVNFLEYGMVEGPAAINNFHISSVGPTATGNHIQDWQVHAAFPFILSDFQQSSISRVDSYTAAVNPYDGQVSGSGNCESLLNTLNEQTGNLVTITGQLSQNDHNCEPAGSGTGAVTYAYADIQPFGMTIRQENFEAGPDFFGGNDIDWGGGQISVPAFNYGSNNVFRNFNAAGSGTFPTNTWTGLGSNQFFNFGKLSSCSMFYGGSGPLVSCGALWNQGFEGKDMTAAHDGVFAAPPMNIMGGQVKPGMWNGNFSFDSAAMHVAYALDPTEPYWGAYAACNLNTSNQCQPNHFFGPSGFMWIGPNSPFLSATPYDLEFNAKSATASGSFTVLIQVFDGGSGLCGSSGTVASRNVSTTTSWQHYAMRVDLTGRAGCFFSPQFFQSSTTDQYRIGEFDMVPLPGFVRAPVVNDSIHGTSCQNPGAYLGSSAAFIYFCGSGGTALRVGVS